MWFLLAVVMAALAGPSTAAFDTATRLIDRLYLERDEVDEVRLLRAATLRLEEDVHWLHAGFEGRAVWVRHGDGRVLGRVEADSMADLPRALRRLTQLVHSEAGTDADPVTSALAGLGDALDRHSKLLTDDRLARFHLRLTGLQVGVGAAVTVDRGQATIVSVHPGGPADRAGLRAGDVVHRVDGRSAAELGPQGLTRWLQGTEGSQVVLEVARATADADPERLVLTRAPVVVPNVRHDVLGGSVGYVHIDHVSQRTVANLRASLRALEREGALQQGLVLDLRQNTGGSMREAARLADQFLSDGLLLRTVGRDGKPVRNLDHEIYATSTPDDLDMPVIVVVDDRTASGAEILAGALLEHERAVIVGSRTYGKGTVQKALPVDHGAHLKLTIAQYQLAHGRRIDGVGLTPDVAVGRVELAASGVHLVGFEAGWRDVVPEVVETHGWRGQARRMDLPVELARRALLDVGDAARAPLLDAVRHHASAARSEQQARLVEALGARGIDWTAQAGHRASTVTARTWATRLGPRRYAVRVEVTNPSDEPLTRAAVHLEVPSVPELDGQVVLVGRVMPGGAATGRLDVELPAGLPHFDVEATLTLWAHRADAMRLGTERLALHTSPSPDVRVRAAWRAGDAIEVTIENLGEGRLTGVEASARVSGASSAAALTGGSSAAGGATVTWSGPVGSRAAGRLVLPVDVAVSARGFPAIGQWRLALPATGQPVTVQRPQVELLTARRVLDAGDAWLPVSIRDDTSVDHVVVWVNGAKVAWSGPSGPHVTLRPRVRLVPGANHVRIETVDTDGLAARRDYSLWATGDPGREPAG